MASERLGVPAVAVMTENFVSAADLMSKVLGAPGYDYCVIDHPVSSASDAMLRERAAVAVEALRRIILRAG